ncbi:SAM-dependent methyltransferase [Paenibacillus selenitireducens]|uniref:SAM-dependent methyltransferase n=1 Tax=Paenibacillus selenitireducens TaxID=1324314 RepID=A0A1T2X1I8_9BACL|nr:class I SAM-dependent methyltransferase [Paenibacillus selenitireducens]OPA73758.1 SAM-dependent methyltransferase [Paenibacillus selenitireducens]
MEYDGSSVYDNAEFLQQYLLRRNRQDSPNNIIEKPVLLELMGDFTGKTVLDLGCWDGRFGYELLQQGCKYYEGVEGSSNMVHEARTRLDTTNSQIHHATIEGWNYPQHTYDIAISRLALHYVQDIQPTFGHIHHALVPGGEFIFSVQHPVLTSSMASAEISGKRSNWIVDEYFELGKRTEPWIGESVVKYHRTFEAYFQALKQAGFTIEDVRECSPRPELFEHQDEFKRRMRIPLFLMFRCVK